MPDRERDDDPRMMVEVTGPIPTTVVHKHVTHPTGTGGFGGFGGFGAFGPTRTGGLPPQGTDPAPPPPPPDPPGSGEPAPTPTPTEPRGRIGEPTEPDSNSDGDVASPPAPTPAPAPPPSSTHSPAPLMAISAWQINTPILIFQASRARNDAERIVEDRLRRGEGTPEEALRWMQQHGAPGFRELPHWDGTMWLFPGAISLGTSQSMDPWLPPATAGPVTSTGTAPGPGAVPAGAHPFGAGSIGDIGVPAGMAIDPPPPAPPVDPYDGGPVPGRTGLGPGRMGGPGNLLSGPPSSHIAEQQAEGALRDIMDKQNPFVVRLVLHNLLAPVTIAALLEQHVLNPLLAAPWELYAAAVAGLRAADAVARGDWETAIRSDREAAGHLTKGAGAILAVLPIGEGITATRPAIQRLAATGVEYHQWRWISRVEGTEWARHQEWVTRAAIEHVFKIDGHPQRVAVDGFLNKAGLNYVDNPNNMALVEVKMHTAVERIYYDFGYAKAAYEQIEKQLLLNDRLGLGGVRWVITEATEGTPLTNAFRDLVARHFPEAVQTGKMQVIHTPPPPDWFTGVPMPGSPITSTSFGPSPLRLIPFF